jgi:hypothetical protein
VTVQSAVKVFLIRISNHQEPQAHHQPFQDDAHDVCQAHQAHQAHQTADIVQALLKVRAEIHINHQAVQEPHHHQALNVGALCHPHPHPHQDQGIQ